MAACAVQAGLVRETVGFARERSCAKTFAEAGSQDDVVNAGAPSDSESFICVAS
jgi:hypothetical protein